MCIEKAINLIVLGLSWLHLGRPLVAPASMALDAELTYKQWGVVKRFEKLITELANSGDFGPSNMGRTAAKVESLVFLLERLQRATEQVVTNYEHRNTAQGVPRRPPQAGHQCGDPGEVVGKMPQGLPQLAKCVEPSRLSFPKDAPHFDPTKFFDEPHRSVYQDPIAEAEEPDFSKWEPPRVRIHASKEQAMELIRFLDRHQRLRLVPEEKVRKRFLCGAFCLVKDEEKDRLILDARPPNMLETTLRDWSKTLGAINAVLQIELLPEHNLVMSGTDLRDYYYCFQVSERRARRNAFNFPLKPKDVQDLKCFSEELHNYKTIYPCLATMAMGDCQAVEMGQKCHVKIGLGAGLFRPQDLLCIHGRAPRAMVAAGIIIDDALFLEQVPSALGEKELKQTDGARRLRAMKEEYLLNDLVPHPNKTFEAAVDAEFWGGHVNGAAGRVRASSRRLVPLIDITVSMLKLGYGTVALLQTLAGAWVSILQFRRRMLCLLDEIYLAQHGREASDIVKLSGSLKDEMWLLVCLSPLAVTDLRAQTEATLFLSDASEEIKASVSCQIPLVFARELHRHALSRGCWTRLLSPWKVWLKQHFQLEEEDALPDGVPLVSHPLWLTLAKVLQFAVFHRKMVRARKHINLLEMESVLELEAKRAQRHQDVRYLLGSDSQIAIAALLKGRSSSPRLNGLLQQSLGTVLGAGIYGSYGYIPSLANVSDDPTRMTDVREPSCETPGWLMKAFEGDFGEFDRWLGERGYDPISVAQLPFDSPFPESAEIMQKSLLQELREVQKPSRLASFEQRVYSGGRVGSSEKQEEKKRPEESFKMEGPKQTVGSSCTVAPEVFAPPKGEAEFDADVQRVDASVGCLGFEKGQKEPEGQTKKFERRLPGKMNRGHPNSVASSGVSQPKTKLGTTGLLFEPPLGCSGSHDLRVVSAMENARSPELSASCKELLRQMPPASFMLPGGKRLRQGETFLPERAGILDLYSGRAAVARKLAKRHRVWVLTFDFEHGSDQNLLDPKLQALLEEAVKLGAFVGVGAAPECCSFSRAVVPPVRSALQPLGLENLTKNMQEKVANGNKHAAFLLRLILLCETLGISYWVENPDGSFLWLLPDWSAAGIGQPERSFRVDLCRYKTPWRKRTRIATNTLLSGQRHLCAGGHSHTILRGRNKIYKVSWTRLAQVYPEGLARDLTAALAVSAGLTERDQKLDIGGCARCSHNRIGEAAHPGPRRTRREPRDVRLLENVLLVEPVTRALQQRVWVDFQKWLHQELSDDAAEQLMLCPALFAAVIRSYGLFLFASGHAMYEFRHLLVIAQQTYTWIKQHLGAAWQLLTKWEVLQPVQHRKPLHFILFQAMVVMALLKQWHRWAGSLVLGFEGIARISEVLRATREDLVLPADQFSSAFYAAFVRVCNPKTKRRGKGRVQHLKISNKYAVTFLEKTFAPLDPALALFPLSAAAFRSRWEAILDDLAMPKMLRPTPASIRGGGAIAAYQRGEPIQDIMWRMRVLNQSTLEHYLQEMAADTIMSRLPELCKHRIKSAALLFSLLVEHPGS